MQIQDNEIERYRQCCWDAAESLRKQCPVTGHIKKASKGDIVTCISELQAWLGSCAANLIFSGDSSICSLMRKVLPGFDVTIGLVSTMQLAGTYLRDRGTPIYRFMLGSDDAWKGYLATIECATSPDNIRAELKRLDGVALPSRVFGEKNASGALLFSVPPAGIDPNIRVLVGWDHSKEGIGEDKDATKWRNDYPWALWEQGSFPMVYALVSRDSHPLGFCQLCVRGCAGDTDKYSGEDDTWLRIYAPDREWVDSLCKLTAAFANVCLAPLIDRVLLLHEHRKHASEIDICFPEELRKALGINNSTPWTGYEKSRWKKEIGQIHALLQQPAYSTTELAKNMIDLLWRQCSLTKHMSMEARSIAEKALFLDDSYRDHMVHILKVFLIGERILLELYDSNLNKSADVINQTPLIGDEQSSLAAFEMQWMLAATIHDFSIPCQLLPDLQESCWQKFFSEATYATERGNRDIEHVQFALSLTNRVFRQHLIVNLWQVLHANLLPQGSEPVLAYTDLLVSKAAMLGKEMLYPRYLGYFLETGDHGIASALWFLHATYQTLKELKASPNEQKNEMKRCTDVARACYFHNLAPKVKKSEDSTKSYFEEPVFGVFQKDALCYLLLLSDFLQDEGRVDHLDSRSDDDSWSKRPLGHITDIQAKASVLKIQIEYCWVNRRSREKVRVGHNECGKMNIPCACQKKNSGAKPCPSESGECIDRKNILGALGRLQSKLLGLPVELEVSFPEDTVTLKMK